MSLFLSDVPIKNTGEMFRESKNPILSWKVTSFWLHSIAAKTFKFKEQPPTHRWHLHVYSAPPCLATYTPLASPCFFCPHSTSLPHLATCTPLASPRLFCPSPTHILLTLTQQIQFQILGNFGRKEKNKQRYNI